MKKAAVWPLAILLIFLCFGTIPAQAASVAITFSGPDKVKAGGTYTYSYKIEVSSAAAAYTMPVIAGGAFEIVSGGDGLMYDTIPDNTSGSSDKGTIEVRVKDSAKPGDKATLSTSGEYAVLDKDYHETEYTFQGSFLASVVSGSTATATPAATEAPTATPEPTPTPTTAVMPEATPTPTTAATPAAAAVTTAPAPSPSAQVTEDSSAADVVPVDSEIDTTNKGPSLWLIAAVIAVFVVASGLVITLYVRRAGPFGKKGKSTEANNYMDSVRRSAYKKRGRHRR